MALRMGSSHENSTPCLCWGSYAFCKWRYNVFNFYRYLTRPTNWRVIRIHDWELLALCLHPGKFGGHGHYGSGDINILVNTVIVKMQNICNLIGWNSVHISDIFNCYRANINGMWKARKLGGIYKTFGFTLT